MSEVKIPCIIVYVFRGVGFGDDVIDSVGNVGIYKGWYVESGTLTNTDGDIGKLYAGSIMRGFSALSSDTYKRIQVRIGYNASGGYRVKLYNQTTSQWELVFEAYGASGPSLADFELPSGKIYSAIRLESDVETHWDFVFITKKQMLMPHADLSEIAEITLPLLEMGISGVKLSIPNNEGEYTDAFDHFDRVIVWLQRHDEDLKKVFGGVIMDIHFYGEQEVHWVRLDCLGLGQELQNPKSLVQKAYVNTNGRTIIKESLTPECAIITDKFVDVDEEIASTHSILYDEALPYEVVNEICKKAQTVGGVIGFDAYVDAAGNLHVFKRNKYTSPVDLTGKIQNYEKSVDAHRIKNKIKVYGVKGRKEPVDGDDWTETESGLNGWIVELGSLTLDSSFKKVGSYSLVAIPSSNQIKFKRNLNFCFYGNSAFERLQFWAASQYGLPTLYIRLYAPDENNYYEAALAPTTEFQLYTLECNKNQIYDSEKNPNGIWHPVGSPVWEQINTLCVYLSTIYWFYLDGLHFDDGKMRGTAEDSVSIAKYGTRCLEPQVDDTLKGDSECQLKAQSLLDFLKEPVESLTLTVEGDNRFTPGDKQRVVISTIGLDAYYRILEVRHVIDGVNWDTILKLSNEPSMIDYITASTAPPRKAGATVIIPRDFSTIQEGIAAVVG